MNQRITVKHAQFLRRVLSLLLLLPLVLQLGLYRQVAAANEKGIPLNHFTAPTAAGVTINPTTIDITEGGAASNYSIVLTEVPTATVTITLTPDPDSQVNVSPGTLTFTTDNYDSPQSVSVSAVNDLIAEGNHSVTINHSASSADPAYDSISITSLIVNISDDDIADIKWEPESISLAEGGIASFYNITLNSQPTAPVTVTLTTDDQVGVNQTELYFNDSNWTTEQNVIITALDDDVAEGMHTGVVTHTAASNDPFYNNLTAIVNASITDNDTAGITYSPSSVNVSEDGAVESYSVVLDTKPKKPVTITITPDAQTTANKTTLTFNASNWDTAQTVIVGAVNDAVDEISPHTGYVSNVSESSDANYDGIQFTITANITDDDEAGVIVTPLSLNATEGETPSPTYNIRLNSQPTATVTATLTIAPSGQISTSPTQVIFTSANWSSAQNVQVIAVDDFIDEEVMSGTITQTALSNDPNYNGISIDNVEVTINDNDTAGISAAPTTVSISEDGLTAVYSIQLDSQPTGSVTVRITQSVQVTTVPIQVTFGTSTWDDPQEVTVSAVNDDIDEGNHISQIAHTSESTDPLYNGLSFEVTAQIADNDFAGITVQPTDLDLSEGSASVPYTVVLDSEPTQPVTISLSHNAQVELSLQDLYFDNTNWDLEQTINITATDDFVAEGPHAATVFHVASSNDPKYEGLSEQLETHITDNDTAEILVAPLTVYVSESGDTESYQVRLNSQPTGVVTITISPDSQLGVSEIVITFDSTNWNTPLDVIVSAVNDSVAEVTPHYGTVTHSSASNDPNYNAVNIPDITAEIADNDAPGVFLRPSVITIAEDGISAPITATYQAELTTRPLNPVVVNVVSSPQFTTSPTSLTFTPQNWNQRQTVTVTVVDDQVAEGDKTTLLHHTVSSEDTFYDQLKVNPLKVNILDNDTPGIEIDPGDTLITHETGSSVTYTIKLTSQPTNTVSLVMESQNPDEGQVYDPYGWVATFYTHTWNTPQTITIIGIDDSLDDEAKPYTITIQAASPDPVYNDLTGTIHLINLDDDGPRISVENISVTEGDVDSVDAVFTIRLDQSTAQDVSVHYQTMNGTALGGSDFTAISGDLIIPGGQTSAQVVVEVLGDTLGESREIFYLRLSNPTNHATLDTNIAECLITETDPIFTRLPLIVQNYSTLILMDDFDTPLGWTMIPENGAGSYLSNGMYHITHTLPNRNVRTIAPVNSADISQSFAIKTTVSLAPGSDSGTRFGILFNWIDQFRFYRYLVCPSTQEYWIYKFQQSWVILAYGKSTAINSTGENTLQLVRNGGEVHAYANGSLLTSLPNETTYLGGGAGLTILSSPSLAAQDIADAAFDFFKIWEYSQ
ncbi:MAG: hypothetical protein JW726_00845 [Anaerolineales bacterium]|nr:hypothetical protein [Anaerolineales bacterium]